VLSLTPTPITKFSKRRSKNCLGSFPRIRTLLSLIEGDRPKYVVLNSDPLYHETIPTIFEVAEHIVNLGIDSDLRRGVDGLVRSLATVEVPPKKVRFNYSFATKYCSWHNPEAYPIFDSRVYAYLCHLVNHGCIDRFIRNDMWDYPIFKRTIEGFKERNRLGEFTFKEIDKFLYLQGAIVIRGREKTTTEPSETGTLETEPSSCLCPDSLAKWRYLSH